LNLAIKKTAFRMVNIRPSNGTRRVVRAVSEFASQKIEPLLNRVFLKKASNEDGIEIRSNLHDRSIHKATYPAVAVIEPEPVLRSRV
jgi:hypothetical protein